jgi:5-methyltetrahydrofolate--homocysteine methyltransferase
MPDHDVFLDCLTFTLGSGDEQFRRSAIETIEAIREVKARHPRVNAILGVSNVSFGLKPALRMILNSAFLHYALEAGLTSAIVHFSKIRPENQIDPEIWGLAKDLVFDRRRFAAAS